MELNTETVNTPPRPAATIVLLRDAHAGLEVLLLKRHALSDVLAGAHVFPGGKVDPQDAAPALQTLLQDSPADLQQRLQESALEPAAAAALHVAAIREAFEESGILLAQDASRQQVETARAWLREGVPFAEALARLQLRLPTRAVLPGRAGSRRACPPSRTSASTPASSSRPSRRTRRPCTTTTRPPRPCGCSRGRPWNATGTMRSTWRHRRS